jgi:hypothetical protein
LHPVRTLANEKGLTRLANPFCLLAGATGLEPATFGVTGKSKNNDCNHLKRSGYQIMPKRSNL